MFVWLDSGVCLRVCSPAIDLRWAVAVSKVGDFRDYRYFGLGSLVWGVVCLELLGQECGVNRGCGTRLDLVVSGCLL